MKKHFYYIGLIALSLGLVACGKDTPADSIEDEIMPEVSIETQTETGGAATEQVVDQEQEPVILEATHVGGFTISGDRLTARGGAYDQDGNTDNGAEPIDWIVIADDGDHLLLLSEKVLEQKEFNDQYTETSWETCTLRTWLNGDFYNAAFNDEEKSIILDYPTVAGDVSAVTSDVSDKVFLLSEGEAEAYIGAEEGTPGNKLCSKVTTRAINAGVWYITEDYYDLFGFKAKGFSDEMIGCGNWWLRTNGKDATRVMDVGASGIIRTTGHEAASHQDGVRPAIYIQISGGNN